MAASSIARSVAADCIQFQLKKESIGMCCRVLDVERQLRIPIRRECNLPLPRLKSISCGCSNNFPSNKNGRGTGPSYFSPLAAHRRPLYLKRRQPGRRSQSVTRTNHSQTRTYSTKETGTGIAGGMVHRSIRATQSATRSASAYRAVAVDGSSVVSSMSPVCHLHTALFFPVIMFTSTGR